METPMISKAQLTGFILNGGTPDMLKAVIREEFFDAGLFAEHCESRADSLTPSVHTLDAHITLMSAAARFREIAGGDA